MTGLLKLREWLCHAFAHHRLACPAYCLMPDHAHFLWLGRNETSDQKHATKLFREAWNRELRRNGYELQRRAYDEVLREGQREHAAFSAVAHYVFENPVRAELTTEWREYPFLGALVPGYPSLNPRDEEFWERFWRISGQVAETT